VPGGRKRRADLGFEFQLVGFEIDGLFATQSATASPLNHTAD
jgi:hypothetical protein